MFTKTITKVAATAALMMSASFANALVAIDGWQLDATSAVGLGPSVTTNIGHLNLAGGLATVEQEVGFGGDPFVGARFSEFGALYSISYTEENCVGLCDFGAPSLFDGGLDLTLSFTGLTGVVTAFDGGTGAINYKFDPGVGTVKLLGNTGGADVELASFSLVGPSGGDLGDFFGIGSQSQGQSTISALVLSSVSDLFRDAGGNSLDDLITNSQLFSLVVTTNKISGNAPFTFSGACSFDAGAFCATGDVTSDGSFDLLRIPEPLTTMLMAIGLLAMALIRRNRSEFVA